MVHQGMKRRAVLRAGAALAVMLAAGSCTTPGTMPGIGAPGIEAGPPPIPREFRAAWVASVANIDWPSRTGLTSDEQKREIDQIVARAADLKLNALIVQVRPAADALYASPLEPWSEYLSGVQGQAPEPYYDPLAYWITAAHLAGIELHAWFNPYRARHTSSKSTNAANHIANTHPGVVKDYGGYQWMDPGEAIAAQRTLDVITDVTRRYDIDGVHVDDYFYPYPVNVPGSPIGNTAPVEQDFPDEPSWQRYLAGGGTLARADWRRQNVDRLMQRIYESVHREKAWVRFGISPFGLGRPDRRPPGIAGFSQYDKLYADVETWMERGWLDYLAPQLYWPIDQPAQAFGVLQQYWLGQNPLQRHVWPGLFTSRIDGSDKSWKPEEILNQVNLTRARAGALGHVHFSMAALMQNRKGIADQLTASAYLAPALIPAATWLGRTPLGAPSARADWSVVAPASVFIQIAAGSGGVPWKYAIWQKNSDGWLFSVQPGQAETTLSLAKDRGLQQVVIIPIDRFGNEGQRSVLQAGQAATR